LKVTLTLILHSYIDCFLFWISWFSTWKFKTRVWRILWCLSMISKWFHNMFLFPCLLCWLMNENFGYHHDLTMESKNRFINTFIHLFLFSLYCLMIFQKGMISFEHELEKQMNTWFSLFLVLMVIILIMT
jgi:hypothetical protein